MTHLIDDKTVAKMGHPVVVILSDVGHPSNRAKRDPFCSPNPIIRYSYFRVIRSSIIILSFPLSSIAK